MDHSDRNDMPNERDSERGYADDIPGGISVRILRAMSLIVVLALVLAGSSVIIFNTENGPAAVLVIVAIAAILLFVWGFRSRTGEPGADS